MTREEYQAHTLIKSKEEAQGLLVKTRIVFWAIFLGILVCKAVASEEGGFLIAFPVNIALIIYLVVYSVKIIKLTREVTRADALFSIFLAPISWIWFYPALVLPLKIVAGYIQPPENIQKRIPYDEKEVNKKFWKSVGKVTLVCGIVFALFIGLLLYLEIKNPQGTNLQSEKTQITKSKETYHFSSLSDGFSMNFPSQPIKTIEDSYDEATGIGIETITYESSTDDAFYYLFVANYDSVSMNENSSDFSYSGVLEGALNGMVNTYDDGVLVSQEETIVSGKSAIEFRITTQGKNMDGFLVYKENSLYIGMVEYFTESVPINPSIYQFLNSFALNK